MAKIICDELENKTKSVIVKIRSFDIISPKKCKP